MSAPTPPLVVEAFGKNAVDPDFINIIPVTTADPGRASLDLGFPPRTMQPVIAGGTPPFGQDMNGILFMLSSHTVYQQAGTPYYYNSTLSTALGGYALGTLLGMTDGSGFWLNRTPNNTTNPDTGGAGWVPLYSYGPATVPGLIGGGPVTLTAAQAKKKLIILQGTLAGNQQIIVPNVYQDWLIVNQTTGAFTLTVKTAAGTGVVIPQGGFSAPVGVYSDTVNVYPTVAPVNLPIDQAATPSTIVQRTNNGYVLATYFNSAIGLENLGMSAIYFEASNDGYIRKITPSNFAAQFALSQFSAGPASNAQVPFSAVLQYAAALFSSPAFTGVPTAPTAGVGTNTTQVATTQFVMTQSLGNGQGWTNVGRALNTPFANSTGRAIQVAFVGECRRASAGGGAFQAVVDGVQVGYLLAAGSTDMAAPMSFVVPPGSSYQVNQSGAYNGYSWAELS